MNVNNVLCKMVDFMRFAGIKYAECILNYFGGTEVELHITPDINIAVMNNKQACIESEEAISRDMYTEELADLIHLLREGVIEFLGYNGKKHIRATVYEDNTFEISVNDILIRQGEFNTKYSPFI